MSTKEETRKRIGQRVRILRTQAGLTQQELADRAGLQRTHIGRIEDGAFGSQVETIQQVAEALGMTVELKVLLGVVEENTGRGLFHR